MNTQEQRERDRAIKQAIISLAGSYDQRIDCNLRMAKIYLMLGNRDYLNNSIIEANEALEEARGRLGPEFARVLDNRVLAFIEEHHGQMVDLARRAA